MGSIEERISDLESKSTEIIQSEEQREEAGNKKKKKKKSRDSVTCAKNIKWSNICVIGMPDREKRGKGTEKKV